MGWTVEIDAFAARQLCKLDKPVQKRLLDWLFERIEGCKNPRHFGEPLRGELAGLWRYRVGDYRIICQIQENRLVVLALAISHRRQIYKEKILTGKN